MDSTIKKQCHNSTMRVLDILDLVSKNNGIYGLKEISINLNIPQSTISPILQTLCQCQFLKRNSATLKFSIGISSFKVGYSFISNLDIIDTIKKYMNEIVNKTDEICQLGILNGKEIVYIAKIEPKQAIKLDSNVGKIFPAHCTALGKALLSKYDNDEIKKLYSGKIEKFTTNTISSVEKLIEAIESVRKYGMAEDIGEVNDQIRCIAMPIKIKGEIFASVSVSIPIYRSSDEKISLIKEVLFEEKNKMEHYLSKINIDISELNFI